MQMTIRGITPVLRAALEKRAREENKSLNQVVLEDLMRAEGVHVNGEKPKRDLSFFTMTEADAKAIEEAHEASSRVFEEDWK